MEKLRLGKMQSCTSFFRHTVIVHVSAFPLVVTMVAAADANIGMLVSSVLKLQATLEPVRKEAESDAWTS